MANDNDQALDNKLAGLDDHLQPVEGDEIKDEPTKPEEDTKAEDKSEETAPKADAEQESAKEGEQKADAETAEDEGYSIDEGDEEDEEEPDVPTNNTEVPTSQLTAEQQFIIDGLNPIKVTGDVAGKTKEYTVYSPEQLPAGFKFLDDRDAAAAGKQFAMLETKAEQLQTDYRNQQTTKASEEFKQREDTADRADIAKLQKAGAIPKFKAQPSDPDFDKDPGVELADAVSEYKDKMNSKYMDEYNAGRPYKHIGFEEAYHMYRRDNPKTNPAQVKEDEERGAFANRTSSSRSGDSGTVKPRVHSGMSSRDLDNFLENLDF